MDLLIFFAIPVAVIILSAIFETFINCPIKIAGIVFSIFLIVAFALGGTAELIIATIIYTILAFITAFIVMIIQNRNQIFNNICNSCNENSTCNCGNTINNTGRNSNCRNNSSCSCLNR